MRYFNPALSGGGGAGGDNVTPSAVVLDYTLPLALPDQGLETAVVLDYTLPPVSLDLALASWDLNLTANTLTLNLHKAGDASTLDVTKITLQDAMSQTATYTLTDSTTASGDGTTIVINLSVTDKAAIVASGFCTTSSNSWITLTTAALLDLSANPIQSLSNGRAMPVTSFTS